MMTNYAFFEPFLKTSHGKQTGMKLSLIISIIICVIKIRWGCFLVCFFFFGGGGGGGTGTKKNKKQDNKSNYFFSGTFNPIGL